MYNKPKHPRGRKPRCPYPDCPVNKEPDPWEESQCVLNKPLFMVIPPEDVHLSCPVHPAGHHIHGSGISWMENNLPDPAGTVSWVEEETHRRIGTGSTENDWHKFSM